MTIFESMMPDKITIKTKDGKVYSDVIASVQGNRVYTERTDIPIQPGDEVVRVTPAGVEERFVVQDPGFHTGSYPIPDTYQMRVRRADLNSSQSSTVIYNITGAHTRFNLNSIDSSTNIV